MNCLPVIVKPYILQYKKVVKLTIHDTKDIIIDEKNTTRAFFKKAVPFTIDSSKISVEDYSVRGHRVQLFMSVDVLNKFFYWERTVGSCQAGGHFRAVAEDGSTFYDALIHALSYQYNDLDGDLDGLHLSSSMLDANTDLRIRKGGRVTVNDIIMAYVLYVCYGKTVIPTKGFIYNIQDAYDMVSNETVASAIVNSFLEEEAKGITEVYTTAPIDPLVREDSNLVKAIQRPENSIDSMFQFLRKESPLRYFTPCGTMPPGISKHCVSETTRGSWKFIVNDRLEIPYQFRFLQHVTKQSVTGGSEAARRVRCSGGVSTARDSLHTDFLDSYNTEMLAAGSVLKVRFQITAI
jgi:hypothetical protein